MTDGLAWLYLLRFEAQQIKDKDPNGVIGDELLGLAGIVIFFGWLAISLYGSGDNTVTIAWVLQK